MTVAPEKRAQPSPAAKPWTADADALLVRLSRTGITKVAAARRIGRTLYGVRRRCDRLRLTWKHDNNGHHFNPTFAGPVSPWDEIIEREKAEAKQRFLDTHGVTVCPPRYVLAVQGGA
jgi:hypothetical protein